LRDIFHGNVHLGLVRVVPDTARKRQIPRRAPPWPFTSSDRLNQAIGFRAAPSPRFQRTVFWALFGPEECGA
jgi:hypothetical protein